MRTRINSASARWLGTRGANCSKKRSRRRDREHSSRPHRRRRLAAREAIAFVIPSMPKSPGSVRARLLVAD